MWEILSEARGEECKATFCAVLTAQFCLAEVTGRKDGRFPRLNYASKNLQRNVRFLISMENGIFTSVTNTTRRGEEVGPRF